jgi:hypothetical protein
MPAITRSRSAPARVLALLAALCAAGAVAAAPWSFSSGDPDGKAALASRPGAGPVFAIEAADDFLVPTLPVKLTSATFTGLLTGGATLSDVGQVVVEIYRVFPLDSTFPPSSNAPTRANSPSDVAFSSADSASSALSFTTSTLNGTFTASNTVQPGGIHASPNQKTGGDGALTGIEVEFTVTFDPPLTLPPNHYFFVPQVSVGNGGQFYWLSSARPIVPPGTPFSPDVEAWVRDANLAPDWLRVGTDVVGTGTFNAAFTLTGTVLDPAPVPVDGRLALALLGGALVAAAAIRRRRARRPGA